MLKSESDFFAIGEDKLIEVKEDEFKGFRVALIRLYDLSDAAGIEGLVLDVLEEPEEFLDFVLHELSSYYYESI